MALYDAFISYSHSKDKPIAAALQSAVQRLGKPWYRRRLLRVFRDDTSLSATPELWPTIERALVESRFLILLASPEAAASQWVGKEIAYWLEAKSADTLLIGVTDSTLSWNHFNNDFHWTEQTPLPPALKGRFAAEPRWVDLTGYRDGVNKRNAKFTELAADFAAAIRHIPKEDLLSQEVRQQRRALTLAWSAAGALLVLAAAAGWQWQVASYNEKIAQEQRGRAEAEQVRAERNFGAAKSTIDSVIFDLAQGLRDLDGMRSDTVQRILSRAEAAVDQLSAQTEQNSQVKRSQAVMFRTFSDVYLRLGVTTIAAQYAERALQLTRELTSRNSAPQRDLSFSLEALAEVRVAEGKLIDAHTLCAENLELTRKLLLSAPTNSESRSDLAWALMKFGDVNVARGELALGLELYREAAGIARHLNADEPQKWRRDLAMALGRVGRASRDMDDLNNALIAFREARDILRDLTTFDRDQNDWRREFMVSGTEVGQVLRIQGDLIAALAAFREALESARWLSSRDPNHTGRQRDLVVSLNDVADVLRAQQKFSEALRLYQEGLEVRRLISAKDPTNPHWQSDMALNIERIGSTLEEQADLEGALTAYQEALQIAREVSARDPANAEWRENVSVRLEQIGIVKQKQGNLDGAFSAFREALDVAREVSAMAPASMSRQHQVSVLLYRLGNVAADQGKHAQALGSYKESLNIRREVSARSPGNLGWREEVSTVLFEIGRELTELNNVAEALASYRESLLIKRELIQLAPAHTDWQLETVKLLVTMAIAGDEPKLNLSEALRIMKTLEAEGRLQAEQVVWIKDIEAQIAELTADAASSAVKH